MAPVSWLTEVKAATTSQNNIVARADYLYDTTWVCQKTVSGWRGNYTFYAGSTYHLPYGQPVYAGAYIGYGVSVDDFLAAAADGSSIFYTSQSNYAGKTSTYYANDCSSFVAWCWGVARQTTATIPNISTYIGAANQSNITNYLELGDCLNSNSAGHVVLVTGLTYSGGTLTQIEITEQTPPQLKRSYYTPAGLASVYSSSYGIYRYTGTVAEAPTGSASATTSFGTEVTAKLKNWVFDPVYYADKYDDLKAAFGYDESALYDHYLNNGITEGRQASPLFNIKYYLNQNNELVDVYGTDYEAAFTHFVSFGQYESSRVYSKELTAIKDAIFDVDFYSTKYPTAVANFGSDVGRIFANYIKSGIAKGRAGSPAFDISTYISGNTDLASAYANDYYGAMRHFIASGQNESRVTSPILDVAYYTAAYSDAAGMTTLEAMTHFLSTGLSENRQGSANFLSEFYYFAHPNVLTDYTVENCYMHYLLSGYTDGLLAAPYAQFPDAHADLGKNFTARLTNLKSGKNWSIADTSVIIYPASDSDAQKWQFVRQSDGSYEITNVKYGTVLTATDNGSADGMVCLAADTDSATQRWYLYEAEGYYSFRTACNKWVSIGLTGGSTDDANTVEMAYFRNNPAQRYTISILSCGHDYSAVVTAPSCTADGYTTYTCDDCGDTYTDSYVSSSGHSWVASTCTEPMTCSACGMTTGTALGHNWHNGTCSTCGAADPDYVEPVIVPTLSLVAPSLNFEDEIYYNVYYTSSDMTDVVEMGLITFDGYLPSGTIDDAVEIIPGYVVSGSNYMSHTNGISSMKLGDALYFRVYAKLSDGTYAYSATAGYHAVAYAKDILANSTNEKMKALVVAMLNYGAAAQVHFDYKTDALVNSFLTDEQKALVSAYSSDMVDSIVAADSSKTGNFKAVSGGYSALAPSVVFEGAFSINFYFTPAKAMDGELKLYYWKLDDYNAADVLTADNATGVVVMEETSVAGQYLGAVPGIAAKQIDQTVYVCGVYESDGVSYPTGVIAYSLAAYCQDRIANGSETMQAFATETVVYGYYAKDYFANLT